MELILLTNNSIDLYNVHTKKVSYSHKECYTSLTRFEEFVYALNSKLHVDIFNSFLHDVKPQRQYLRHGCDHIFIGKLSTGKTSLFTLDNDKIIRSYELGYYKRLKDLENPSEFKLTIELTHKFVQVFQRDYTWYFIFNNEVSSILYVFSSTFICIKSIQLVNEPCHDVHLQGVNLVLLHNDRLTWYEIITSNVIKVYTLTNDSFFRKFLLSEAQNKCIALTNERDVFSFYDFTEESYKKDKSFLIVNEIYHASNDTRFNLCPMYYPFVQCIPNETIGALIKPHQQRFKRDIFTQSFVDHDRMKEPLSDRLTSSKPVNGLLYCDTIHVSPNNHVGIDLSFAIPQSKFDDLRHLYELLDVERDMESYLLYIHPLSQELHFIPDITGYTKILNMSKKYKIMYKIFTTISKRISSYVVELTPCEKPIVKSL